ncbi:MAG: redoxin domain-containing protein [Dehalococcoidia bacterium]
MGTKTVVFFLIVLVASGAAWGLDGLQIGMKAPGFSLRDLDGVRVNLSDFKESKLIVVAFFATWSDSSAELLERLGKLSQQYATKGLAVLGVNVESQRIPPEEEAAVKRMTRDLGLDFPILVDRGLETFRSYGVVAVPSTIVADPSGTIIGELSGYPIALREALFDLIEATITGKKRPQKVKKAGYQPQPRAVRYFNLARALVARGSVDMADADLKKSIESDPKFVLPLLMLGQLLQERALTDEAVEFQGRTYTTAFFSEKERDQYLTEATGLFQKALQLESGNPTAMTGLASILALKGQKAEAERLLKKALQTNPSYTPAHYQLGALLLLNGDVRGGRRAFEAAKKLNPLDYHVYLTLAQAYEKKGMQKDALELYKKSLELLWSFRKELFPLSFAR